MKKERNKAGENLEVIQPATKKTNLKNNKRTAKSQIKGFKKQGYVRWWRGFRDDPLWKQKRKFSNFEAQHDLYVEARGVDSPGFQFRYKIVDLERGQLVTSQRILAKRWRWSRGSVENFLKNLERRRTIITKSFPLGRSGYTIITLVNYNELNPLNEIGKK